MDIQRGISPKPILLICDAQRSRTSNSHSKSRKILIDEMLVLNL